jgi:hypothetical protein
MGRIDWQLRFCQSPTRQPALAADLLLALALSAIEEPDVIRNVALALALMLVAIGT